MDNPHTHISNFKRMTSTLKYRDVPNDAIKLMLFLYSLEEAAKIWYEKEPPNSILTWDDLVNKFVNQFFPPSKTTHLKNEISLFIQRFKETFGEAWERFKEMLRACPHHRSSELTQIDTNQPSVCAATGTYNQVSPPNRASHQIPPTRFCSGAKQSKQGEMKAVTTRSGLAYEGPPIPTKPPLEKVVERDTEETTDKEQSNCQGSTAHIQPPVVPISISEPDVPKTQSKPTIPYPSRLNDQKLREKTMNQIENFFQIFHDLHFDISFAGALLLMPKFASTIKSLLTNKDKLFELEKVPLNENCSVMLLKKHPEKLGDPGKSCRRRFHQSGEFHFPTDFVVVDLEANLKVPLVLGRSFLGTGHALIDVYGEKITLRVNDEFVTFNLNQTMRYSSMYDDKSVNRVDVIYIAYEEFVQDVLDFQYNSKSKNLTLVSNSSFFEKTGSDSCKEPIVKSSSPTLTPFGESDFFLEEIEDFLNVESIPTGIENSFYDPEGDILYLEKFVNEDPFQLPPMDLKQTEETKAKSSIEEPPKLELKELPSHLEYAFLEDTKLPVIISKDLKDVEKKALIEVLKSHKRAIAWKISDIKGSGNLAANHLSRLENPHKDVLENKDINENFPLDTLGSLSCDSTSRFADIANFHAGNFIKKG
nr:reverse transcriptase domain-containing protein [Tanacetum cinerariifolium]